MKCKMISSFISIRNVAKQFGRRIYHLVGEEKNGSSLSEWKYFRANVKKGYFSVLTKGSDELKKFQVALYYLHHPPFVKLLEAAAEEFGFDQPGVLVVPCEASELQTILAGQSLRCKLNSIVC